MIIGLPCLFTVRHQEPAKRRDGSVGYYCDIEDIFPMGSVFDEPPF